VKQGSKRVIRGMQSEIIASARPDKTLPTEWVIKAVVSLEMKRTTDNFS